MPNIALYIKNMCCNHCIMVVTEELSKLGFEVQSIEPGKVELVSTIDHHDRNVINGALAAIGFELIDERKSQIIEKVKTEIIKEIYSGEKISENMICPEYLSRKLGCECSYLSNLFSSTEGITIEKFITLQKIERAKELLVYEELSLAEVAVQLGYGSVRKMSNQFKKITGLTPLHFKEIQKNKRISSKKVLKAKKCKSISKFYNK